MPHPNCLWACFAKENPFYSCILTLLSIKEILIVYSKVFPLCKNQSRFYVRN